MSDVRGDREPDWPDPAPDPEEEPSEDWARDVDLTPEQREVVKKWLSKE
jgi:hypothetical protein